MPSDHSANFLVYHRTDHAEAILSSGFRDTTDTYMTSTDWTGVWVSDVPLDANNGAAGDTVIEVQIAEEHLVDFEWVEEGKGFREWLVPAEVLNLWPRRQLTDEEVEEAGGVP